MIPRAAPTLFALALLASCSGANSNGWEALSLADQQAFQRCQNAITLRQCPPVPGALDERECVSATRAVYAGEPGPAERRHWLATHGCARAGLSP